MAEQGRYTTACAPCLHPRSPKQGQGLQPREDAQFTHLNKALHSLKRGCPLQVPTLRGQEAWPRGAVDTPREGDSLAVLKEMEARHQGNESPSPGRACLTWEAAPPEKGGWLRVLAPEKLGTVVGRSLGCRGGNTLHRKAPLRGREGLTLDPPAKDQRKRELEFES